MEKLDLPPTIKLDGNKVKKIREDKGLTQLYVATVIGVTTDTISRWENKRYPSIKRENAVKLAEALGVSVEELLEDEKEKAEQAHSLKQAIPESTRTKRGFRSYLLIFSGFLLGILVSFFYASHVSKNGQLDISVKRYLPFRCGVNTPFPVVLQITIRPESKKTILITEDTPKSIRVIKTIPQASTQKPGLIKWLFQGEVKNKKFIYIANIPANLKSKKYLRFKGKVTIKSDQAISIDTSGDERIKIEQIHWADRDGNFIIDDEEILEVYDLLSGVKGIQNLLTGIEKLWAAGGYYWSEKSHTFLPKTQPKRGPENVKNKNN